MKTEMCQTILNGYLCKYGSACTFAHSLSELATMGDRQERGKLDLSTFKRSQCFTQLATGACPFGDKCNDIHDPRMSNMKTKAWLAHYERNDLPHGGSFHVDTAKSIQQSSEQYGHPYGPHCHLLRSWDDFHDLVTNASVNRLAEFNKYLNAVFMPKDEQKKVLSLFPSEATINKFEHTHFLVDKSSSMASGAGVPIMLLGKKKIVQNGMEKNVHHIIFKDPSVKMTFYQRAILLGYDDSYFCPKDMMLQFSRHQKISSSYQGYRTYTYVFGSAFYIHNHPDCDVNALICHTLNVHLGEIKTDESSLREMFQSLSRFYGIMSKQMPKIPKDVQDVENSLQYLPGVVTEDLPYYAVDNFIPGVWKSVTENSTPDHHGHGAAGAGFVSKLSTFRLLRDGHSICHSDTPLPTLGEDNLSDDRHLEKMLHVPELVIVWNHTILNFISDKFKRMVNVREIRLGHHEVTVEIDKGKAKVSQLVATIRTSRLMSFNGIHFEYSYDVYEIALKIKTALEEEFNIRFC